MPENKPQNSSLFQPIIDLFNDINTFKQLVIFIIFVTFLCSVYLAYENRILMVHWAMSEFGLPEIDESSIDANAKQLTHETGAQAAIVYSLNLNANQQTTLYVSVNGRRMSELEGLGDLALRAGAKQTNNLINILNNKDACYPIVQSSTVDKELSSQGIKFLCAAEVPPYSDLVVGMIVLGFNEQPDNDDYIKQRIIHAAERIIK